MAWVRYDDQFYGHPKVTAVIAEDPGAIALHVLANTWTNGQKHPGYIPAHQPGVLVCDRSLGAKWASVLVHATLWHERGQECDECREEYADLPVDAATGYVIHNAKTYRAPARERQTPGTPAEISAKRREAGRKGGLASAAKQTARANDPANAANDPAKQANLADLASTGNGALDGTSELANDAVIGGSDSGVVAQVEQRARANAANAVSNANNLSASGVSPEPEPEPEPEETLFAAQPSSRKRATRLPDDFAVSPQMVSWAREHTPHVDIGRELIKFRNHWIAKGGKEATKLDWGRTWQNWMLNAFERLPGRTTGVAPPSNAPDRVPIGEQCPEHRGQRKNSCRFCRADQIGRKAG